MTINSSSIPSSTTAKSSPLLAGLGNDGGAARRSGQSFAQLLGAMTQPPAKPAQPPLPERAPMPRVEVEPPAREVDVPRSTEPVPVAPDRAPNQVAREVEKSEKPAEPDPRDGRVREAANAARPATAGTPAKAKATSSSGAPAKQPVQGESTTTTAVQSDEPAAGTVTSAKRGARSDDVAVLDDAGALTLARLAAAQPEPSAAAGLPSTDDPAAAAKLEAEAKLPSAAGTPVPTADPASLASLMPSIAQAVFGPNGSAAQPGSGGSGVAVQTETASTGINAPASDGALSLPGADATVGAAITAATHPGAAAGAKHDPLDGGTATQAVVGAGTRQAETQALAAGGQETVKASAIDSKPLAGAASFGQMLQAAAAAAPASSSAPQQAAAAATPVTVYSALHEPGFAPEMASRLTLLASEGVQKAQLHLNPAEMGPVSVQIQLDGQQAQIEFHAQHAATREVLERSLPELAAALRDAGMTLSGGGVFQQQRDTPQDGQAQNQAAGQGRNGAGQAGNADKPGPAMDPQAKQPAQRGVLDMYA